MLDKCGREIEYLRLSVTELCNLRCKYCMGEDGIIKKPHDEILTKEEMISAVSIAARHGVKKVRITGGEPLVKKNILSICEDISKISGIEELGITTNGIYLKEFAKSLYEAGVSRVNISLDTLDKEKYRDITRLGKLADVLEGLETALATGFKKVKINTVLLKGVNDDDESLLDLVKLTFKYPIDVRFIELMPMFSNLYEEYGYVAAKRVYDLLGLKESIANDGVCSLYHMDEAIGNIGLITPMSHKFCGSCNRIRITADGFVKPCLHSNLEYNIKGLDEKDMEEVILKAIYNKPLEHNLSCNELSDSGRFMNTIGG